MKHCDPVAIARTALALAPTHFVADTQARMVENGVAAAVRTHDTGAIYTWILSLARLQGISDRAADRYAALRGEVAWADIAAALDPAPSCPRLWSHWNFEGCGFRKHRQSCAEPTLMGSCPLPRLDLRKGALNVGAFALALFLRDIAGGDLVGWIDGRLDGADGGGDPGHGQRMRDAVALPFAEIAGIGPKLANMILADLLIGADPMRNRWVTAGGAMVAIDSLVHNLLARTGIIDTRGLRHAIGPACYQPLGCASVIEGLAADLAVDHECNDAPILPRQLQHALWHFASEGGLAICHGRRINDAVGCGQHWCPAEHACARLPLR